MPSERTATRRAYIDWMRGLAVLLMIEAHTFDAWTRPAARHSSAFSKAIVLGGFAAPLFLWLAGMAAALSAFRISDRRGRSSAMDSVCRRGLEIFILAFLFRLQAFVVSPGSHPVMLFRVDILNIMGPAIVVVGLVWAIDRRLTPLVVAYGSLALGVAMVTPIVRTAAFVDDLPLWFQWYLRPFGDLTAFTLFPWSGFVFGGAACGVLVAASRPGRSEGRLHIVLSLTGLVLVSLGWFAAGRPSIYRQSSFWSSSPTWFVIRAGILMIAVSIAYAVQAMTTGASRACRLLERLGRSSLFVYWIHVELVYGYLSWPWRGRLSVAGVLAAFSVFCLFVYGIVLLKERLSLSFAPARRTPAPQAATGLASMVE